MKYTYDEVEAAMCIWEWMLERMIKRGRKEYIPWVDSEAGAAAHRALAVSLAPDMEKAYRWAVDKHEYDSCFDWDFVPMVLGSLHTDTRALTSDPCALVDKLLG